MHALVALSLLAPADAAVSDEFGAIIVTVMGTPAFACGQVASLIENIDPTWACELTGVQNTITEPVTCAELLDAACVDVGATDADLDGYTLDDGDCDDGDAAINPGAIEVCDGVDNDCVFGVDTRAADASTWYADLDGDGYGDPASVTRACDAPADHVSDANDCDDGDPTVFPLAGDTFGDGIDGDCDGLDCQAGSDGGSYFALCFEPYTWHDARAVCQDAGYDDLASVADADDQSWLEALLQGAGEWASSSAWIGYADEIVEGSWGWADGSGTSYTNWAPGEPNNSGGDEDCAELNWPFEGGGWNDAPCYDYTANGFYCEVQ